MFTQDVALNIMKWILLLTSLLFSSGLLANTQYTESECILLQHQINDFSHAQRSSRYLAAKKAYDRYCANPQSTSAKAKFASQQGASEVGQITRGVNTQSSVPSEIAIRPKIAAPVELRNSSIPPTQVAPQPVNAFELMLSSLIPMGLWFGFALLLLAAFKAVLVFKAGSIGEWRVNSKLKELTKGTNLTLYENLLLYTDSGEFTEVDHLLVGPFGVFVIESKNYSGWIFGSEKQANWTQRTFSSKSQFMNPLRQNYKHCLAVKSFLGIKEGIESLVVFHDKATFKTEMPKNVIMLSAMNDYINGFTEPRFSKAQLDEFNVLLSMREEGTTAEDYKTHIQQVKARRAG